MLYKSNSIYFENTEGIKTYMQGFYSLDPIINNVEQFYFAPDNVSLFSLFSDDFIDKIRKKSKMRNLITRLKDPNLTKENRKNINFLQNTPKHLLKDFIRGVFENKATLQPGRLVLRSVSHVNFLEYLDETLIREVGVKSKSFKDNKLIYGRESIATIGDFLYPKTTTQPYLFIPKMKKIFEYYQANSYKYTIHKQRNIVDIKEVEKLLLEGKKVQDIAKLFGHNSTSNFIKIFKESKGVTPLQWKKQQIK